MGKPKKLNKKEMKNLKGGNGFEEDPTGFTDFAGGRKKSTGLNRNHFSSGKPKRGTRSGIAPANNGPVWTPPKGGSGEGGNPV